MAFKLITKLFTPFGPPNSESFGGGSSDVDCASPDRASERSEEEGTAGAAVERLDTVHRAAASVDPLPRFDLDRNASPLRDNSNKEPEKKSDIGEQQQGQGHDDDTIAVSNVAAPDRSHRRLSISGAIDHMITRATFYMPSTLNQTAANGTANAQQHHSYQHHQHETRTDGVLIAFGKEQLFSAPALLLLCPFAGLVTTFVVLDQEDWVWQNCLRLRNIRRVIYGFQCASFSILVFLGLEVRNVS